MSDTLETEAAQPQKRGISSWLVVSLAVNALLVGLVGGRFLVPSTKQHTAGFFESLERHDGRPLRQNPEISKERIRTWRRALHSAMNENLDARQQMQTARREAVLAIMAEPYDAPAVKDKIRKLMEVDMSMRLRLQEAAVDSLEGATPEERIVLLRHFAMMGKLPERPDGGRRTPRHGVRPPSPADGGTMRDLNE